MKEKKWVLVVTVEEPIKNSEGKRSGNLYRWPLGVFTSPTLAERAIAKHGKKKGLTRWDYWMELYCVDHLPNGTKP